MHPKNRYAIDKLLEAIVDCLRAMDDREIDLLLHGKGTLSFTAESAADQKPEPDLHLEEAARETAKRLANANTRDSAREIIGSIDHPRRREFLVLIAKASDVRVGSKDSIARIENKLIEAVVGSKLRSRAFKEVPF